MTFQSQWYKFINILMGFQLLFKREMKIYSDKSRKCFSSTEKGSGNKRCDFDASLLPYGNQEFHVP